MRLLIAAVCLGLFAPQATAQSSHAPLREIVTTGISVFTPTELRWTLRLIEGAPLPEPAEGLAARLHRRYAQEGYVKATVEAAFDESSGVLTLRADEGRIDAVAFEGLEQRLADDLTGAFAIRPGSVYNTRLISRAVRKLLEPTRDALKLQPFRSPPDPEAGERSSPQMNSGFDLVERDGRRTLVVSLRREESDFDPTLGSDSREDWYSPVDGLNLALGFDATIFDHRRFNHTYLQGYVSYKFARETAGYSLGIERAILGSPGGRQLFLNGAVHEITSSDDFWRLTATEQSLVALTFNNTFRDYHEERGYTLGAAFRPNDRHELLASWRSHRHEPLENHSDYSLFRDDERTRGNRPAADGSLNALVLGYTADTRGLADERGQRTLTRHTGPNLVGTFAGTADGIRFEWTSEVSSPTFGGDFDFTRHIANARFYRAVSPRTQLRARLIVGVSSGTLPPQRLFALGGIGSVHGYAFKEASGEGMLLGNFEYRLGSTRDFHALAFLDVGRLRNTVAGPAGWLNGVGVGVGLGDLRVDVGWRLNDIPQSTQVIVRFGPTF